MKILTTSRKHTNGLLLLEKINGLIELCYLKLCKLRISDVLVERNTHI